MSVQASQEPAKPKREPLKLPANPPDDWRGLYRRRFGLEPYVQTWNELDKEDKWSVVGQHADETHPKNPKNKAEKVKPKISMGSWYSDYLRRIDSGEAKVVRIDPEAFRQNVKPEASSLLA